MNDDIFKVIEAVIADRVSGGGTYTAREKVYDVFRTVEQVKPGTALSCGEVAKILIGVNTQMHRGEISRCVTELQDTGRVEFAGKESRHTQIRVQSVPVYRAVVGEEG